MKSNRILGIIALLALVLIIFFAVGKSKGWFGQEGFLKVATEIGEERNIIEIITANGKIQPETEVKITPDVSGEIVELAVKEGDYVEKGQFLLKIKPENYIMMRNRAEASLNNAKARETQAKAQLQMAKLEFARSEKLFKQSAISEAEYEQAQTSYNTAKENLEKTSIHAPMSGTISALFVELGERVVGTEMMSGTEILRIADLNKMEVEVEVNENDIVRVAYMDTALIEVDAYIDTKFKGVVTEIPVSANTTGITTDQVTNFNVKILLLPESYEDKITESNPYPLRPGMSATADIQTEVKYGVYSIPIMAVTTRVLDEEGKDEAVEDEEEKVESATISSNGDMDVQTSKNTDSSKDKETVVFVEKEGKAYVKKVKTGIQDNTYIEVVEGLEAEDMIIKAPYSAISKQLKDDISVEVVEEEELYKDDKKKK